MSDPATFASEQSNEKDGETKQAPKASPWKKGGKMPGGTPDAIRPGLYLVATPIGNLRDITFRALDVLSSVDIIVCEDTRVTGKLMAAYGFKKRLQVYNDHSTERQRETLLELVKNGHSVAVLSDAGTPMISDPGYKLVRAALDQEIFVTALPGANAALTALQLSGLPTDKFSFLGFLPNKQSARQSLLDEWRDVPGTLIAYETGPRLMQALEDIKTVLGERDVAVMRELTKLYEETKRNPVGKLIAEYRKSGPPKGEIVLAIGRAAQAAPSAKSIEEQLKDALKDNSVRDAAELVARATGKPKKTIYTLALKLAGSQRKEE